MIDLRNMHIILKNQPSSPFRGGDIDDGEFTSPMPHQVVGTDRVKLCYIMMVLFKVLIVEVLLNKLLV